MRIGAGSRRGRARAAAVGVALLLAGLTACSAGTTTITDTGGRAGPGAAGKKPQPPAAPAVRLALQPTNGAQDVSPLAPVVVTAAAGTLSAVALHNETGKSVRGRMSDTQEPD